MKTNEPTLEKETKQTITEILSKNTELYNKYTMLLASIFISALTAIGQHTNHFNCWLKVSVSLFSISLITTLCGLTALIIRDSLYLNAIPFTIFSKISLPRYKKIAWLFAFISLLGFLLGLITINIFIFTL